MITYESDTRDAADAMDEQPMAKNGGTIPEVAAMQWDHERLAELVARLEHVRCDKAVADGCCEPCPETMASGCRSTLASLAGKLQHLLLQHFRREDELMASLPVSAQAKSHCVRHRGEHVKFSTQYNLMVARLGECSPAAGAAHLEALVIDWIRNHATDYDAELSAILGAAPIPRSAG